MRALKLNSMRRCSQVTNAALLSTIRAELGTFITELAKDIQSVQTKAQGLQTRLLVHAATLAERHALQEAEYRKIVAASAEQGERAAERQDVQTSLNHC